MPYHVQCVLPIQAHLAECPVWSVREQVLYFADILAPAIHRFNPATGDHHRFDMPEHTGCFGLREQGGFIAAMRTGLFLLNAEGQVERRVAINPTDPEKSRFNDGRVDAAGRFWCGTIWEPRDHKGGKLCRLDSNMSFSVQAEDVLVSNGLAFSPDGLTAYHTDTPNHLLYRYPIDASTGDLGPREVVREFERGTGGRPDGAAVDSEGFYWSAMFDGSRVVRINPTNGEIVDEIPLPVRWPTMVAFGGDDLKTLYITSSRENRTEEELAQYPLSGNIFAVRTHVTGREEPRFKG